MFSCLQIGENKVTPKVRLFEPFDLMKKLYKAEYKIVENNVSAKADGELFLIRARVIQNVFENGLELPITLYNHNFLHIYEIDDSIYGTKEYKMSKYVDFIGAHAITCSTNAISDEILEFNPNVKVFKNQISELLPVKHFDDKDCITIFFGALNRADSYEDILPVLNSLVEAYDAKLCFTVVCDRNFFNKLNASHKTFIRGDDSENIAPFETYMNELYKADIALLPLKDNSFNRAKSDLKFIESANAQTAVLASPTVYEDTIKDGETGFIYRSPREFQAKFEILLKDRKKRIEMSKAAYEYVKRERLLIDNIEERYDWMREMYAKRHELHEGILKRYEALLEKLEG